MLIRKCIIYVAGLFLVGLLLAQPVLAKPDFTGTWIRDYRNSDPFSEVIGPRVPVGANFTLDVDHKGNHLLIEEQAGKEIKRIEYSLGRSWLSSLRPGWRIKTKLRQEVGGITYRSKWKGGTLVIEKDAGFRGNYGGLALRSTQEWELSSGGRVLTIRTVSSTNNMPVVVTKEVFIRK